MTHFHDPKRLSRRHFGQWVVGSTAIGLAACTGADEPRAIAWNDQRVAQPGEIVLGLYPREVIVSGEEAVRAACKNIDFSWLSPGDSVLIKIVSNSGNLHPAVTSPAAVRGMVAELFERGAGRVVVGEQSGVEYVRLIDGEQRVSSTDEQLQSNGLLQAIVDSGAESHFFDDHGFADGYFAATAPQGSHWSRPLLLPRIVEQVDHIVYLPRLSSHVLAGSTLGLKLAVGWLRDDSRNHLHNDAESFYEKYAEISYCDEIRSRFRMVLTLAEKVMLHFGPDTGTAFELDQRLVIASQSLANHDALAASVLQHLSDTVEPAPGLHYDPATVDGLNQLFLSKVVPEGTGLPWDAAESYTPLVPHAFEQGVSHDRPLGRAWELEGGRPETVAALVVAEQPDAALASRIASHGEGSIALS